MSISLGLKHAQAGKEKIIIIRKGVKHKYLINKHIIILTLRDKSLE